MKIELFYDKECPFCNSYTKYISLKEKHNLSLLNARDNIKQLELFKTQGFDINNGFIIKVDDDKTYQGADAIVFLNELSKKKVYFPDNYFFRFFIYPIVKLFRKVVLIVLGKKVDLFK